jgi:putative flippase GtrA
MIEKIKGLLVKYRELIVYAFFGVLTTAVDFGVYWILERVFSASTVVAQSAGVVAAIIFAFVVNKWFVFGDKRNSALDIFRQFASFASMRLVSGAFQTVCMWIFVDKLSLYDMAVKAVVAVVVVILNYIFSKLLIFKKNPR